MRHAAVALLCLGVVGGSFALAQPYRCGWDVVGSGGGTMSGTNHRVGATTGQTAAGPLAGANFRALIGYWQTEVEVGIRETAVLPNPGTPGTRLESITPNPNPGRTRVSFALEAEGPVSLTVHDPCGRQVRTLATGNRRAGRFTAVWRGDDDRGRQVPNGIYFCHLSAGGVSMTGKLVLARPGH